MDNNIAIDLKDKGYVVFAMINSTSDCVLMQSHLFEITF